MHLHSHRLSFSNVHLFEAALTRKSWKITPTIGIVLWNWHRRPATSHQLSKDAPSRCSSVSHSKRLYAELEHITSGRPRVTTVCYTKSKFRRRKNLWSVVVRLFKEKGRVTFTSVYELYVVCQQHWQTSTHVKGNHPIRE